MNGIFIRKIIVDKVRHLEDLTIDISDTERKHLILTGKNGSGKTSVLEAMRDYIAGRENKPRGLIHYATNTGKSYTTNTGAKYIVQPSPVIIYFSADWKNVPFYYFPADHKLKIKKPTAIEKVDITKDYQIDTDASSDFLKYILYLDYQRLSASNEEHDDEEYQIQDWFNRFVKTLCSIYDCPRLELKKEAKDLNFKIVMPGYEPFGLNEMADGYSALLKIVMELMMRMENQSSGAYDMAGIALIDEIETHLHVELQKKVLPFLTTMFPNIQFIVTTHSPFVLSSIENAVICDLERKTVSENFSAYSYEGIVEYYFNAEKFSDVAKANFDEYKMLVEKKQLTTEENARLADLISYFDRVPVLGSPAIMNAFMELELRRRSRNDG